METLVPMTTPVPMPADWAAIHAALTDLWQSKDDSNISKPPVPLILAGAAFSSAAAIRQRWIDLIQWANANGFSDHLASRLPQPPSFDVADKIAGVSEDGRGWWPVLGEQFHEPMKKPSNEVVSATFQHLVENWPEIVGHELAESTKPLKFTGRKQHRLLVAANPSVSPPWGSWYTVRTNPPAFTAFRRAINRAISPMEVDDVTFTTEKWPR
jgi:hypothetical protein